MIQNNDAWLISHSLCFTEWNRYHNQKSNDLASHVLSTYFSTQDFSSFHRQLTYCKYTISFCTQLLHPPGGGELPYETDGDARRKF